MRDPNRQRIIPTWKPPVVKQKPRYTLAQISELTRRYVAEVAEPNSMVDWRMSDFLLWLAKREREVGDGG